MLKMRAPGAKTFLQVIKARFGSRTHLVFCTFAFLTNLIVMMSLTIAGTAVLNRLSIDLNMMFVRWFVLKSLSRYRSQSCFD